MRALAIGILALIVLSLSGCSTVSVHDIADEFLTSYCARMETCGDPSGVWHWDGCKQNYMDIVCAWVDCDAEVPADIAYGRLNTCLDAFATLTCDEAFPWPRTPECAL